MIDAASFARLSTDDKMSTIFSSMRDLRDQIEALSRGQINRLSVMAAKIDELVEKVYQSEETRPHQVKDD